MKLARFWINPLAIAAVVILLNFPARADTYQIYDLGDGNFYTPIGIDNSGAVVIENDSNSTYSLFVDGMGVSESSTPPPLFVYDNGTPCSPVLDSGMSLNGKASCNGAYEVFGGAYLDANKGIYTGPGPADFLQAGTVDILVLNSSGDFAWTDGRDEENFEAIDLTSDQVPEPSSLILLGTGLLAAAGMRRHLFSWQ
jgi:hypothetical protein